MGLGLAARRFDGDARAREARASGKRGRAGGNIGGISRIEQDETTHLSRLRG